MPRKSNVKDPTLHLKQFMSKLIGIIVIAIMLNSQLCQAHDHITRKRMRRDYSSSSRLNDGWPKGNLSCVTDELKITCDCGHVNQRLLLPQLSGFVKNIEIRNCKTLTIDANSLEGTEGLRKIIFKNIGNLVLNKFALSFPRYASNTPLIVIFEDVNFEIIDSHAINGNIEEILFFGGRIDAIHPYSFTTLQDHAMLFKMDNVLIKGIEAQALKKFAVEEMEITNCIFDTNVPSKTFYELEISTSLRIHNVRFREVHSHAFSFKMISKLTLTNNHFVSTDAEWIVTHVLENVIIRENNFGVTSPIAFSGIKVHRDYRSSERLELRFINNTVQFPNEPLPLEFNERFALNLKNLRYSNNFSCTDNLDTTQNPPKPKKVFFQNHIENIYFQNDSKNNNQSFLVLSKLIESDCQQPPYIIYISLGIGIFILLIAIIIGIVCLQRAKKRKRRELDVVKPEPRTYKETQIIYQIENAGLLKTDL